MPHDPTAAQVIAEWAAMIERLYGTATPTGSTDSADERAASEAAANLMSGQAGHPRDRDRLRHRAPRDARREDRAAAPPLLGGWWHGPERGAEYRRPS